MRMNSRLLTLLGLLCSLVRSFAQDGLLLQSSKIVLAPAESEALIKSDPDLSGILRDVDVLAITYLSDGLRVKGYLAQPKKGKNLPCIIYNRGGSRDFGALTNTSAVRTLGRMASWGYVVVASHYRGNLGGEGTEEYGGSDVIDVLNLLHLLKSQARADSSRTGMYGRSRGGMMTYLALSRTAKISAAVVDAGVGDLFDAMKRRPDLESVYEDLIPGYRANTEAALESRSAVRWVNRLNRNTPILLLHGTADWRAHPAQAINMASKLLEQKHPFRLVLFEGGDHALTEHRIEADRIIRSWMDKYVRDRAQWPGMEPHGN